MDNNFILRILLEAKDNMSLTVARARAELEAFTKSGDELERRADTLNRRLDTLNRRMDTFGKRGDKIRETFGVAAVSAEDFEARVAGSTEAMKDEEKQTIATSDALQKRIKAEKELLDIQAESAKTQRELVEVQRQIREANADRIKQQEQEAESLTKTAEARAELSKSTANQAIEERALQIAKADSDRAEIGQEQTSQRHRVGIDAETESIKRRTKAKEDDLKVSKLPDAGRDEMLPRISSKRLRDEQMQAEQQKALQNRIDEITSQFAFIAPDEKDSNKNQAKAARDQLAQLREQLSKTKESNLPKDLKTGIVARLSQEVRTAIGFQEDLKKASDEAAKAAKEEAASFKDTGDAIEKVNKVSRQSMAPGSDLAKLTTAKVKAENDLTAALRKAKKEQTDAADKEALEAHDKVEDIKSQIFELQLQSETIEKSTKATERDTDAVNKNTVAKTTRQKAEEESARQSKALEEELLGGGLGDPHDPLFEEGIQGMSGGAPDDARDKARDRRRKKEELSLHALGEQYDVVKEKMAGWQEQYLKSMRDPDSYIFKLQTQITELKKIARSASTMEFGGGDLSDKALTRVQTAMDKVKELESMKPESISNRPVDHEGNALKQSEAEARENEHLKSSIENLSREYNEFSKTVDINGKNLAGQRLTLSQYRDGLKHVAEQLGRKEFRSPLHNQLAGDAQDATLRLKQFDAALRKSGGTAKDVDHKFSGLGGTFQRLEQNIRKQGESVATLDNKLRGLLVLAVLTFAQQFSTVLLGLGGALVSVAGSAVMAGSALGGALAAGLAGAIPMIGLVIASLAKLKSVMDVVQQSDLVKEQNYQRQNDNQKKAATTSDALANAQDGLRAANEGLVQSHQRVRDAEKGVTDARVQAREEILKLIQAERDAELAARGAVISQKDAQDQLRASIASGDITAIAGDQLGVDEANNSKQKADSDLINARKAVRKGNLGGTATDPNGDIRQAKRQLDEAKKGADDAARSVDRASRAIKQAGDNAADAATDQYSALEKLQFMLKQLSPAERDLYKSIQNIRKDFKKNFGDVTDLLVEEYAKYVDTADRMLKDPKVHKSAKDLSYFMAGAMDDIRRSFSDQGTVNQMLKIIDNSKKQILPVTDILKDLGHAFLNIAEEAGPSLSRILNYLSGITDKLLVFTQDQDSMKSFFKTGTDNLLAWADMLQALINLFAAFTGASQGTGLGIIEDATKWLNAQADNVRANSDDMQSFFADSRKVLATLLHLLGEIAKAIVEVFNPDHVENLAKFIEDVLLPTLVDVVKIMGGLSDLILKIADTPVIGFLTKITIGIALLTKTIGSLRAVLIGTAATMARFGTVIGKGAEILGVGKLLAGGGILAKGAEKLGISKLLGGGGAKVAETAAVSFASGPAGAARAGAGIVEKEAGGLATKFGGIFTSKTAGFLKGFGWTQLGFSAVSGILSAFKHDSLKAGVNDLFSTLTFGLVKSTEDKAKEAVKNISGIFEKAAKTALPKVGASAPKSKQASHAYGQVSGDINNKYGLGLGTYTVRTSETGAEKQANMMSVQQPNASKEVKTPLQEQIDKLRQANKGDEADFITKLASLYKQIDNAVRNKDLVGVNGLLMKLDDLKKQAATSSWAKDVTDDLDTVVTRAQDAGKKINAALAPQTISKDLAYEAIRYPKKWKSIIDGAMDEIKKLPPSARRESKAASDHMIDELERAKEITPKQASDMRTRLNKEFDLYQKHVTDKSQKAAQDFIDSMGAMAKTAYLGSDSVMTTVRDALEALGTGKLDKPKAFAKGAGASVSEIISVGSALLYGGKAEGGWVGGHQGQRGPDAMPVLAGAGEAFLTKPHQSRYVEPAMRAYWGFGLGDMFKRSRGQHGSKMDGGYAGGGFVAQPGTNFSVGQEPQIVAALRKLSQILHKTVYGISGYRTPAHSVEVGGFPNDPHTQAEAADVGVGAPLLATMQSVAEATLRRVGLYRPFYPADPGEVNHVQLLAGSAAKAVAGVNRAVTGITAGVAKAMKIVAPKIKWGQPGMIQDLLTASMKKITKSGQNKVEQEQGSGFSGSGPSHLAAGANGAKIFQFFKKAGFTDNQAAAFVGNFVQESGLNPAIIQPNGEGHGLAQWGGGRFTALQGFAAQKKTGWQDLLTQLQFVMHELSGPESSAYHAIKSAKTLQAAVDAVGVDYERFGIQGDRYGPAEAALKQYGRKYDIGGGVPGSGPQQAVLHGGEHVWTAAEVMRAGGHKVMYALRSLLGGGTQGNDGSYKLGGKVLQIGDSLSVGIQSYLEKAFKDITADTKVGRNSDQAFDVLKQKLKKAYTQVIFDIGTNDATAEMLAKNLRRAHALLGDDQQMVISTVHGPKAASKNKVLRSFAKDHDNVDLVDSGPLRTGRGAGELHFSPEGYKARAKMFVDAMKEGGATLPFPKNVGNRIGGMASSPLGPAYGYIGADLAKGKYDIPTTLAPNSGLANIQDQFKLAEKAIHNLRKNGNIDKRITNFAKNIERIAGTNGLLETMSAAIDQLTTRLSNRLALAQVGLKRRGISLVNPKKSKPLTDVQSAKMTLANTNQVQDALEQERHNIEVIYKQNQRRIQELKKGGITKKEKDLYEALMGARINLLNDIQTSDSNIAANLEAKYEAQADLFQKQEAKALSKSDNENSIGNFFSRVGSAYGRDDLVNIGASLQLKALQDRKSILEDYLNKAIANAKKDPRWQAIVQDTQNQILDASASIVEAIAAQVQTFMSYIDNFYSKKFSFIDTLDRYADIRERGGDVMGAGQQRLYDARLRQQTQAGQLQTYQNIQTIAAQNGNQGVVDDMTEKIIQLSADMQDTAQTIRDLIASNHSLSLSIEESTTQTQIGFISAAQGIAEKIMAVAKITDPSKLLPYLKLVQMALLNASVNIGNEIAKAINDPDHPFGNQEGAADQFLQMAKDAFFGGPEQFASFLSANAGSLTSILSALGPDTAAGQLFQSLLQAMIDNTNSQLDNTQAIQDAMGGQELQGFSTSAWELFQSAIFNGLGDRLPQYEIPQMAAGGVVTKAGIFELHAGERVLNPVETATYNSSGGDTFNMPITKPIESADPETIARKVLWAKKTRGR